MFEKSPQYAPSKLQARANRAAAFLRQTKTNKARDTDWKQEMSMLNLLGYTKRTN